MHDAEPPEPSLAFEIAHLASLPTGPTPIGLFRSVSRPVYGRELAIELERSSSEVGTEQLRELLHTGDTWTVS